MPDRIVTGRSRSSCGADVIACGECCANAADANTSTRKSGKPKMFILSFPPGFLATGYWLPATGYFLEADVGSQLEEAVLQHVRRTLPGAGSGRRIRRRHGVGPAAVEHVVE